MSSLGARALLALVSPGSSASSSPFDTTDIPLREVEALEAACSSVAAAARGPPVPLRRAPLRAYVEALVDWLIDAVARAAAAGADIARDAVDILFGPSKPAKTARPAHRRHGAGLRSRRGPSRRIRKLDRLQRSADDRVKELERQLQVLQSQMAVVAPDIGGRDMDTRQSSSMPKPKIIRRQRQSGGSGGAGCAGGYAASSSHATTGAPPPPPPPPLPTSAQSNRASSSGMSAGPSAAGNGAPPPPPPPPPLPQGTTTRTAPSTGPAGDQSSPPSSKSALLSEIRSADRGRLRRVSAADKKGAAGARPATRTGTGTRSSRATESRSSPTSMPAGPNLGEIIKQAGAVKLKRAEGVDRSPGGTPLRRNIEPAGTSHASVLALALRRKFRSLRPSLSPQQSSRRHDDDSDDDDNSTNTDGDDFSSAGSSTPEVVRSQMVLDVEGASVEDELY